MLRTVPMFIFAVALGCSSPETAASSSAVGTAGASGSGGANSSSSSAEVSSVVTSGASGTGPVCVAKPCATDACGSHDDDCGHIIFCGLDCGIDSVCTSVTDGTCCTPYKCEVAVCGPTPDGCGGSVDCGACPGTWQSCESGACVCANAFDFPNYDNALKGCQLHNEGQPFYCGDGNVDGPPNCKQKASIMTIGDNQKAQLWCCE